MAQAYIYRADDDNVLWTHDYPHYHTASGVSPVVVSDSTTAIVDPNTDDTYLYEFYWFCCNQDVSNAVVLSIGVDLDGGTTNDHLFYNAQSIAAKATTSELGPVLIDGNCQINAIADNPNDAVIFWRLKQVRDPLLDA